MTEKIPTYKVEETPMTPELRDFFAAHAMHARLAKEDGYVYHKQELAKIAYEMADAMLEVRNGSA